MASTTLRPLYPQEILVLTWQGGCVDPKATLNGKHQIKIPAYAGIRTWVLFIFIYLFTSKKQLKTAYDELWGEVNFVHVFIILWSLS